MTHDTPSTQLVEGSASGGITSLVIRESDSVSGTTTRTIRIPVKVFTIASTLVPRRVRDELAKEGIGLDDLRQAVSEIRSPTTLVEVEEHEKHRRIVVCLE